MLLIKPYPQKALLDEMPKVGALGNEACGSGEMYTD